MILMDLAMTPMDLSMTPMDLAMTPMDLAMTPTDLSGTAQDLGAPLGTGAVGGVRWCCRLLRRSWSKASLDRRLSKAVALCSAAPSSSVYLEGQSRLVALTNVLVEDEQTIKVFVPRLARRRLRCGGQKSRRCDWSPERRIHRHSDHGERLVQCWRSRPAGSIAPRGSCSAWDCWRSCACAPQPRAVTGCHFHAGDRRPPHFMPVIVAPRSGGLSQLC